MKKLSAEDSCLRRLSFSQTLSFNTGHFQLRRTLAFVHLVPDEGLG